MGTLRGLCGGSFFTWSGAAFDCIAALPPSLGATLEQEVCRVWLDVDLPFGPFQRSMTFVGSDRAFLNSSNPSRGLLLITPTMPSTAIFNCSLSPSSDARSIRS